MAEMTYSKAGDYLIPDVALQESRPLGKYGMMRKSYLKDHRPVLFSRYLLSEKLFPHCLEIEDTANGRLELLMKQLQAQTPPPDKAVDPMGWAAHMNSLKAQAEETIYDELIYS
jgi:hypothetical protein